MKRVLLLSLLFFLTNLLAQVAPPITNFIQANTSEGSFLRDVVATETSIYYIGSANQSEAPFDGIFIPTVGLTDLYVVKNEAISGQLKYAKAFNAGSRGRIYSYSAASDADNNLGSR